jgi:hypothetical protein
VEEEVKPPTDSKALAKYNKNAVNVKQVLHISSKNTTEEMYDASGTLY